MPNKILLTILLVIPIYGIATELRFNLPTDVAVFIEKRDLCDHFRGEPAYDEERRKFLLKNMNELCAGSDSELSSLKSKYRSNQEVKKLLSAYEDNIEPNKWKK